MFTLKLDEIIDEIFQIAIAAEYNNINYSGAHLVKKKMKRHPSEPIAAIAGSLKRSMVDGATLSKVEIMTALEALKSIGENYKIKELKKPIADLKAYLAGLG